MQRNWIGRSEGAEAIFRLADNEGWPTTEEIKVFTTRPDTLYGATYMVLSPEHPLVERITTAEQREAVRAYQAAARKKSDLERTDLAKEKTGAFTGAYALNPVNGEKTPVWIADYVLATYGTGAIMAVPAHDQRDYEFATKFGLPIKAGGAAGRWQHARAGPGLLRRRRQRQFRHHRRAAHRRGQAEDHAPSSSRKNLGRATVSYRLRDWVFSRQRYWGEPIPIVHCQACGVGAGARGRAAGEAARGRALRADRHRRVAAGRHRRRGSRPRCPTCGGPAKRETNTMPQWAGSCWYYLRYLDPKNDQAAWSPEAEKQWQPVDLYVGGAEHAVLHLLYSRFWHKVLFDLGHVSTPGAVQEAAPPGHGAGVLVPGQPGPLPRAGRGRAARRRCLPQGHRREAQGVRREDGQVDAQRHQSRRRGRPARRGRAAPLRDVHGRVRAAQALGSARHRGLRALPASASGAWSRSGARKRRPRTTRTCACATRPSAR